LAVTGQGKKLKQKRKNPLTTLVDLPALLSVRQGELNLPVQAPGSQESGVQGVLPVRGHDHLNSAVLIKSVHLVQKLQQDTLHFSVGPCLRVEPWQNSLKEKRVQQNLTHLFVAMASTSSINTMEGEFSLASLNTSRTIRGPSPRYFCTNSLPTMWKNVAEGGV
jgi:hypothetical protein